MSLAEDFVLTYPCSAHQAKVLESCSGDDVVWICEQRKASASKATVEALSALCEPVE